MRLSIDAFLDYTLSGPADLLLALEIAQMHDQVLITDKLIVGGVEPLRPIIGDEVQAMSAWIQGHLDYVPGSSDVNTTAADTYVGHRGVCRDFAHLLIAMARAAGIPARMVGLTLGSSIPLISMRSSKSGLRGDGI